MKRLAALLLCWLLTVPLGAQGTTVVVKGSAGGGGGGSCPSPSSMSDILFWHNGENGVVTGSANYTLHTSKEYSANTIKILDDVQFTGTADWTNGAADTGDVGLDINNSTSGWRAWFLHPNNGSPDTTACNTPKGSVFFRLYKTIRTVGASAMGVFGYDSTTSGPFLVYLSPGVEAGVNTDFLRVVGGGDTVTTDAEVIDAGVWYSIEIRWDTTGDSATDYWDIRVNGSSVGSNFEPTNLSNIACTAGFIFAGNGTSNMTGRYYMDTLVVSNDDTRDLYNVVVTCGHDDYDDAGY